MGDAFLALSITLYMNTLLHLASFALKSTFSVLYNKKLSHLKSDLY